MSKIKYKIQYKIKKTTKKLSILLILNMLIFSAYNIASLAEDDSNSPIIIHNVISPDSAVERDEIKINVFIKNDGTENVTEGQINVSLFIDDDWSNLAAFNSTEDLEVGEIKSINLTWRTELGELPQRKLNIRVEYKEDSDSWDESIVILERNTDLTFCGDIIVDGQARVNKTVTINAIAENIGKNTTEEINASLFIAGEYHQSISIDGLSKDEKYNLSFKWTPQSFGSFLINISLYSDINEYDYSNNYIEITIHVDVARFDWWDSNWHYRKSYRIDGTGNISVDMNFTEYLKNLSVTGENFENDTIVIVEYLTSGEVVGIVDEFYFNESLNFDPVNKSTGILSWYAEDAYYCVFFDVDCNPGTRNQSNETLGLNLSDQGVSIGFTGCDEGWWSEWAENMPPLNNYYLPYGPQGQYGDEMYLKIDTKAIASEVKAKFVWNNTDEEFLELVSLDGLSWEGTAQFTKIGDWNLTIISIDDAGYQNTELTHDFYVGYPDLTINSLDISSESSQYGTFYEGTDITIKANVVAFNTTVYNVNVSLIIDENYIESIYMDIEENNENIVSFIRSFSENGTYNIEIYVDPKNNISESNEFNNSIDQNIKIEGRPDIGIINLTIPSKQIFEGDPVEFTVRLHNYGIGNATHYRINLYIEQNDENNDGILDESMYFKDEKNHTFIDLKINETKNINLVWDAAEYGHFEGEWIVGIKVISNSSYPDSNKNNNMMSSLPAHLIVIATIPREELKPVIQLIRPGSSERFEQGKLVEIRSKITDDSGIKKVELEITDPEGNKYSHQMTNEKDDEYFYEFEETDILGRYYFNITAFDTSIYENNATVKSNFIIVEDDTPPKIKDFRASPSRQLKNKDVKITCIVTDYSEVKLVQVTVVYPDDSSETKNMEKSSIDDKFIYTKSYEKLGKYTYYISAEDELGSQIDTKDDIDEFWITNDLEDTDSDGMPDWWEEKYGFDPFNPSDALEDEDDDGFTNVEEYEEGTDPLKPITFLERMGIRLKENQVYLLTSLVLFILLLVLSIYGIRRETT